MNDKPISGKDFLSFMTEFKETMEKTVNKIDKKLDDKFNKLGTDIDDLKDEVKNNEKKMNEMNKFLKGRMTRLEQDLQRLSYKNMKSDTLGGSNTKKGDTDKENEDKNSGNPSIWKNSDEQDLGMRRQNSWADEVEEKIRNEENYEQEKIKEMDRRQWTETRRIPTCWTDDIEEVTVRKQVTKEKVTKTNEMTEKEKRKAVKNWFAYENDETDTDNTSEEEVDEEGWSTIERRDKKRNKDKRNRIKRK